VKVIITLKPCRDHDSCIEGHSAYPEVHACSVNRATVLNHIKGACLHALGDKTVVPDVVSFEVKS
jgi:hypothetical protein